MREKKTDAFDWVLIWGLPVALVCALTIALQGWGEFVKIATSQNTSAWVQAVGSIAALIVALKLARNSEARQVLQEERSAKQRLEILQAAVMQLMVACTVVTNRSPDLFANGFDETRRAMFNDARALLADIELFQIPDPLIAIEVVKLRHSARDVYKRGLVNVIDVEKVAAVMAQTLIIGGSIAKVIGKPYSPQEWLEK